jgi:hypothetical protein
MVLYRSLNALTLASILVFSAVLANARAHHYTYHRHYGYGYGGRWGSSSWCRIDFSPRDPVYFKKADNRCAGVIY